MAIIKPEQLLPNSKKPDLKVLLADMGDRLRNFGMGYPLPQTLSHGNENFPMFEINKVTHNNITRQHIDQITDSFAVLTSADIRDMESIKEPLKEDDFIDKKLTLLNVDRFLTHVTNMLEQATSLRDGAPTYMGGRFARYTEFKLAEAWDAQAVSPRRQKHRVPEKFESGAITELCNLVAQCHLLIRSEPLSAIIKHHVDILPQPVEALARLEEAPTVTPKSTGELKLAPVMQTAATPAPDRSDDNTAAVQQAAAIPAPYAPDVMTNAFKG